MRDISVLTVNFNTENLIVRCVDSVLKQKNCDFEMIVIDNASEDGSVSALKKYENKIKLIANNKNVGFGKANNQGFKISEGRYLFLLNPDAVCLAEDDLSKAIQFMDNHPDYGLVGTRIIDNDGRHVKTVSDHYPRQKYSRLDFSKLPGKCACVLGASMLVRRDVFESISGFDEDFFLYAEETDLCLRIRRHGFKIGYTDTLSVMHVGSASTRTSPPEQILRRKKLAKYLFYKKHYSHADLLRIAKKDYFQALFQRYRLQFKKIFIGLNKKDERKLVRHRVAAEIARDVLKKE